VVIGLVLLLQVAVPAPRGFVNDFAGVLDSQSIRHMEAVSTEVRSKTRGEIAVVTLPDIGDRPASEVALQIGRQWGVGAKGEAGDPAKNQGVVVLLVPMRNHERGTGQIFISTGRGAEGFLTDAASGRIRDAMIPYLAREDYAGGLSVGVDLIAQAFAKEFGVTLDSADVQAPVATPLPKIPIRPIIAVVIMIIILNSLNRRNRRRRIWRGPWGGWGGGRGGGGGWGGLGGGGGGWGGGGGGGFGGFGGGGGFSGGGAGGKF